MKLISFIFYVLCTVCITWSSKCPESRKPHDTSCTIFYNCVNLPNGGYVWVPSKCTEGLVFQPFLRICVIPGDMWTCEETSSQSSLITNKYDVPELINPNQTSYLEYNPNPSGISEPIDSSFTINDVFKVDKLVPTTPYPLIQIEETIADKHDSNDMENIKIPFTFNRREENYLYEYADNRQIPVPLVQKDNYVHKLDHYTWLSQLISHLSLYKRTDIPLETLTQKTPSTYPEFAATTEVVDSSEHSIRKQDSLLLNYLIQNYIQKNLHTTAIANINSQGGKASVRNNTDLNYSDQSDIGNSEYSYDRILEMLANSPGAGNSIVMVTDNFEHKRYFTVQDYKSADNHIKMLYADLIPCSKNVRLPNKTECSRYYTCDPSTASVSEHSCPSNTAFNEYSRVCDTRSYDICREKKLPKKGTILVNRPKIRNNMLHTTESMQDVCSGVGKWKDSMSDNHYYICYSSSDSLTNIKATRMACPNNLIFCQTKKVCTTKRLCSTRT